MKQSEYAIGPRRRGPGVLSAPQRGPPAMKYLARLAIIAGVGLLATAPSSLQAAGREVTILEDSAEVLEALAGTAPRAIPAALLHDAQGLAIIPGLIKAGFVIGGRHGRG